MPPRPESFGPQPEWISPLPRQVVTATIIPAQETPGTRSVLGIPERSSRLMKKFLIKYLLSIANYLNIDSVDIVLLVMII